MMNAFDRLQAPLFEKRAADWRNGAVVYQVLVDRFAPSKKLEEKKKDYAAPRKLRDWGEIPKAGSFVESAQVWSHEIDFWGGDLSSLRGKLDYIQKLGVDTVYLNPIFASFTNHKYDAWDYNKIDPAFGTRADLAALTKDLHSRKMKLVLDGVFNHMGRQSPFFQEALANPKSKWRNFYKFGKENSYVSWMDVANLPELNLENPRVQDYIYAKRDSVMQSYVRKEGIDGWRLDVAFDIGFEYLRRMNEALHGAKQDAVLIGEIWNYPEEWFPSVDGVMNMHGRALLLKMLEGKLKGSLVGDMWETMIADAGIENVLKSWLVLDNHDTPRLSTILPSTELQKMARMLQFTLPGSPCLYYGSELGMTGGDDPEQRAPMRWDLVKEDNELFSFHKKLLAMRKKEAALRYGDFRKLHSDKLFAFLRKTNSVRETVVVLANPTDQAVQESIPLRESKFQDYTDLKDLFTGKTYKVLAGLIDVDIPPHGWVVLKSDTSSYPKGYNRFDRIY
ncbi:MAG TPA: hypothetical protein DD435_06085 [Cyanobacteria bacterium UBA8530]|nr:hypothetical protein [Cyanobacteria bacterium UBA8530]